MRTTVPRLQVSGGGQLPLQWLLTKDYRETKAVTLFLDTSSTFMVLFLTFSFYSQTPTKSTIVSNKSVHDKNKYIRLHKTPPFSVWEDFYPLGSVKWKISDIHQSLSKDMILRTLETQVLFDSRRCDLSYLWYNL